MRFDRDLFFEHYRRHFGEPKFQYRVDGLNRLLTGFETYYGWWDDIPQIANAFAQVRWETARSYTPVVEAYYLGDPSKAGYFQGNTQTVAAVQRRFYYFPHIGRGDIQLTHKGNYEDQDARVRKYFPERVADFEKRTGKKFDLITNPEQALDGWISFCIFTIGMHLGTFRSGHNLDRYITPTKTDHFNARDIVNGDKNYIKDGKKIGTQIKEDAVRFEAVLKAALIESVPPQFTETEIDDALDSTQSSTAAEIPTLEFPALDPAGSNYVETPDAVAGDVTTDPVSVAGELPDVEPSSWMRIEDWKPFVARWMGRLWGVNIPANVTQFSGFSLAAIKDPGNWYIYIAIGVIIFLALGCGGVLISGVLLAIWYFNRKEVNSAKMLEAQSLIDPNRKNLGLRIERK